MRTPHASTRAQVPGRGCVSFVRLADDALLQHALTRRELAALGHVAEEDRTPLLAAISLDKLRPFFPTDDDVDPPARCGDGTAAADEDGRRPPDAPQRNAQQHAPPHALDAQPAHRAATGAPPVDPRARRRAARDLGLVLGYRARGASHDERQRAWLRFRADARAAARAAPERARAPAAAAGALRRGWGGFAWCLFEPPLTQRDWNEAFFTLVCKNNTLE